MIDITHQFSLDKQTTDTGSVYQNSHELMDLLRASELNWFLFVEVIEQKLSGYTKAVRSDPLRLQWPNAIAYVE